MNFPHVNTALFVVDAIELALLVAGLFLHPLLKRKEDPYVSLAMSTSKSKKRLPMPVIAWIVMFVLTNLCGLFLG